MSMSATNASLQATEYPNPSRMASKVRRAARRFDAAYDWNQLMIGIAVGVLAAAAVTALSQPAGAYELTGSAGAFPGAEPTSFIAIPFKL